MRRSFALATIAFGVLLLLTCGGFFAPIDFALNLAFGWVIFVTRVVPQARIDGGGVAMAVFCLLLFVAGAHSFLGWLYAQMRGGSGNSDPVERRWKPRWTASLVALFVVMFVAGLATAGVAHQVGWLLTSEETLMASGARLAAMRTQSLSNLKQIGIGLHNYHEEHGAFPPGGTFDALGRPLHGWQAMLLPYFDRQDLYDGIDFAAPWGDARNASVFRTMVQLFLNPGNQAKRDAAGYALSHYAGNAHLLGGDIPRRQRDVKDGTSNTLMASEVAGGFKPWGDPTSWRDPYLGINRSLKGFGSPSPGGASFLFADGSVRFLRDSTDPAILKAMGTPSGGEVVRIDQD